MEFRITVEKKSENQIMIESPAEFGNQILSLLLKKGYTLIEFLPEVRRSVDDVFDLENHDMKYYSLMILAQIKESDIPSIAKYIQRDFGGYLYHGENYVISSDVNDFATL